MKLNLVTYDELATLWFPVPTAPPGEDHMTFTTSKEYNVYALTIYLQSLWVVVDR